MTTIDPRVQHHIQSLKLSCTIRYHEDFPAGIRTPADFADALGYQLARITKSVFCHSQSKASYALLVGPIDKHIDFKRASQALDVGRLEVASSRELEHMIGYPRLGVSPFGLDSAISVVVARELLGYESVLVGAGVVGVEIEVSPFELVHATNAFVENIAKWVRS
jgi:Cys-tRNA(Pro)/Cys-tRNA(Cys) deacylase